MCVPLNVRGVTLGLLHIGIDAALTDGQVQELRTLAVTVSASIKLGLANIRLQATLRDGAA